MTPEDRRDLARELLAFYDRTLAGDVKRLAARFGMELVDLLELVCAWAWVLGPISKSQEAAAVRAVSALATIARTRCTITEPQCNACPLVRWCKTAQEGGG